MPRRTSEPGSISLRPTRKEKWRSWSPKIPTSATASGSESPSHSRTFAVHSTLVFTRETRFAANETPTYVSKTAHRKVGDHDSFDPGNANTRANRDGTRRSPASRVAHSGNTSPYPTVCSCRHFAAV